MESEHIKAAGDKLAGKAKEAAGKVTGDNELELKGKAQQVKGDLKNAIGDAKDAVE